MICNTLVFGSYLVLRAASPARSEGTVGLRTMYLSEVRSYILRFFGFSKHFPYWAVQRSSTYQGASVAVAALARAATRTTKRKSGAAVERIGGDERSHAAPAEMKAKHRRCEIGSGIAIRSKECKPCRSCSPDGEVRKRGDEQRERRDQPRRLIQSSGRASSLPTRSSRRRSDPVCVRPALSHVSVLRVLELVLYCTGKRKLHAF